MFVGFVKLEFLISVWLQVVDANKQPVAPDAAPTFRVYGPSGLLQGAGGTSIDGHTGAVTGATNASPIVITETNHGRSTGQRVTITGVGGNSAANGTFTITKINANTYSLDGSTGNGAYTSGGLVKTTGFFVAQITCTGANGFDVGENYACHFSWQVSTSARAQVATFGVV
jgi:hypothetical protein